MNRTLLFVFIFLVVFLHGFIHVSPGNASLPRCLLNRSDTSGPNPAALEQKRETSRGVPPVQVRAQQEDDDDDDEDDDEEDD